MLEHVVGSYGAPDEVAQIYRDQEIRIQRAIHPPAQPRRRSLAGRFFGVAADPHTYAALFYMMLSLATGIFYFTWAVTGLSLLLSLSVLIIGLPFIVLFFGSVRVLSLVEGRVVEAMLGMRMPRRPVCPTTGMSLLQRIGRMFTDVHTWTTLCYMWLMLPLGIVYFTVAVTLLSVSVAFIAAPLMMVFHSGWLPAARPVREPSGHRGLGLRRACAGLGRRDRHVRDWHRAAVCHLAPGARRGPDVRADCQTYAGAPAGRLKCLPDEWLSDS
jgi:hypothetical protein